MTSPSREYALLCADITEFSKAMEVREHDMGIQTMGWVERCVSGWLSEWGGQLLHQSGDGIFLAFQEPRMAVRASHRLRKDWSDSATVHTQVVAGHELRIALHWGRLMRGKHGYVAHSLNQVSRLCALALPGQTWCSVNFWRQLPVNDQHDFEDLGTMHFKHMQEGMKVLRQTPKSFPGHFAINRATLPKPRLLIHSESDGDPIAWVNHWVNTLQQNACLEVAECDGPNGLHGTEADQLMRIARADFLLLRRSSLHPQAVVELWAHPMPLKIRTWMQGSWPCEGLDPQNVTTQLLETIDEFMTSYARSQPQGALSHGQLQAAALHMMHAGGLNDFHRSADLLIAWSQRFNRHAQPRVWQALWHVMRYTRGLGFNEVDAALHHLKQALALEPEHAHAHAAHGYALAHLQGDVEKGMRELERAQTLNPDLHWIKLYRSVLWCFLNQPQRAMLEASWALAQTPQDPMRGFALGLAGHAAVYARQPSMAIKWLEDAWAHHRHHSPILRMLVVAHQMLGNRQMAGFFLRQLMTLEPGLTARTYMGRARVGHAHRAEWAHWLMEAGLPMK